MSTKDKLIERFKSLPRDFTWDELVKLFKNLGFEEKAQGKTVGSGRKFFNQERGLLMNLHKPHLSQVVKIYMIKQIMNKLKEERLL